MKLVFSNGSGLVLNHAGQTWKIDALPPLSFACDGVFFDDFGNHYIKHINGGHTELSVDECAEIALFLLDAVPPPPPDPAPPTIEQQQAEARAYLISTDWYFARLAETGHPVPEDVLDKRAEARALLQ